MHGRDLGILVLAQHALERGQRLDHRRHVPVVERLIRLERVAKTARADPERVI